MTIAVDLDVKKQTKQKNSIQGFCTFSCFCIAGAIAGRASFSGGFKDMRTLEEMDTLKEIPGYKAALKAVLKSQIQYLVILRKLNHGSV